MWLGNKWKTIIIYESASLKAGDKDMETTKYIVKQLLRFGIMTVIIFLVAKFISPYLALGFCMIMMASSFHFCRYCDKWGKNCECKPMNPAKDAKN